MKKMLKIFFIGILLILAVEHVLIGMTNDPIFMIFLPIILFSSYFFAPEIDAERKKKLTRLVNGLIPVMLLLVVVTFVMMLII